MLILNDLSCLNLTAQFLNKSTLQGNTFPLNAIKDMDPSYLDRKFIEMVDKWMKESEDKHQDPYVALHWYNATGEEKEITFDNVQELGQYLRENPGLGEKVGYRV